ncbi:cytochrome P450 20A1 [Amblyraja radiata]|uniref:cytochrome P450 20A1 n=1 Tax=Amblyraja radiata TaxID=386614 RepID=UPI00140365A2|nr:cytochrome P450 20A1 [Amblyraja radiata]XP_055494469.1 cytochrome P450 20A1 [Leucoraja erinacea]
MLDFAIFAITFVVFLISAVLYLYPASRQASGIPGMTPTEEKDGNLPDIVSTGSLHQFLVNLHEKYGSIASFWFGRRLVISLGSLDFLEEHINPNRTSDPLETMLKSLLGYQAGFGGNAAETHARKKVYEAAVNKAIQNNFTRIVKLAEELVSKWLMHPESQHVPLCQHLLGFAMKSVTQTAMGNRFENDQEVICFQKGHDLVWSEIGKGFLDGSLDKSSPRKEHYEAALEEMEATLKKVAKERKGKSISCQVFMDSLLQSDLSEKQVLEDSMIFSLAGSVITANLCIWATYFLATSKSVQEKLYQEVNQVLGNSPLSFDKLQKLRYCQQVLNETVRAAKLTPVAARLQELEGNINKHLIPKEALVIYALGVVLQDEASWDLPYRFDPERFNDEAARKQFTLLGFSGSLECPELRFAYTVATIMLSTLIKKLSLHPVEGQVVEMKYDLVTTPKEEAWITVNKRS